MKQRLQKELRVENNISTWDLHQDLETVKDKINRLERLAAASLPTKTDRFLQGLPILLSLSTLLFIVMNWFMLRML